MKRVAIILLAIIMVVAMAACGRTENYDSNPSTQELAFPAKGEVPVNEKTVRFLGRYYEADGIYYTNMSCSGFEVYFEGNELKAELISEPVDSDHNTYIHVFLDDHYDALDSVKADGSQDGLENDSRILLKEGRNIVTLAENLEFGVHKITVQKANQSSLNKLGSVKLLPGDGVILEPPGAKDKSILVIGDSITCGSNNLGEDLPISYSASEDGLITMAAIAARQYDADIEVVAKNGLYTQMICSTFPESMIKYVDPFNRILEIWDTTLPGRQRDLVIINLGINDANVIGGSNGSYTYDQFQADYITLLKTVRTLYPECYILCTDLSTLANYEKEAVSEYTKETGDEKISFWKRSTAYSRHPLVSVHKSEAKQLVKKIDKLNIFR
ncbi:MAG: hypothetical protein KIC77_04595 [Clostridiales bacterium]|nr:hypothetical protein [Clostridiales bacterium]